MIESFGADSVRFFILSDSPPEKDIQWSDTGMTSAYKFVQKFWQLNQKILSILNEKKSDSNNEIDIFTNQTIAKVNAALEKFRYNVIIAQLHEVFNFYNKLIDKNLNYLNLRENYQKILILMMPVMPHLSSECLQKIKKNNEIKWPEVEKEFIKNEINNIVVQINGKKRSIISTNTEMDEKTILKKIQEDRLVEKYINGKKILKTIYVKNKIINIII